tara:strand:+ start:688 stop:969 length:282 start_codon:yes stop_codon:yes gene_type:complete
MILRVKYNEIMQTVGDYLKSTTRQYLLEFWLFISAFGIMFAVLSWMQESELLPDTETMGPWKGVLAVGTGAILYWTVARNMTGGPGVKSEENN